MSESNLHWMRRALALAERGRGFVEPNPLVGAVVVRDGTIVGEGWHQRFGEAHAEVHALAEAGEAARGATLYVTLEPCCHHGKTPPCTDAVLRAGIARVVMAMTDPFPKVAGQGIIKLVSGGVSIQAGIEDEAARRLNAPYLKLLAKGRPYVHAKWAMSLDGKIATRTGNSKWISNEASRVRGPPSAWPDGCYHRGHRHGPRGRPAAHRASAGPPRGDAHRHGSHGPAARGRPARRPPHERHRCWWLWATRRKIAPPRLSTGM